VARQLSALRDFQSELGGGAAGGAGAKPEFDIAGSIPAVLQGGVAFLTPAVSELLVFVGTLLFFLVGTEKLRRQLITLFETRDARITVVRIWNDVEQQLATFVATVSVINLGVGAVTALMLYLVGFPNPLAFGVLAFVLNFIPYIGPAMVVVALFAVGLISLPSLAAALVPPLLFVALATLEGHLITPSIVGRRLTLNPFLVFLALAFWTWLWGPLGAFLATPLLIVGLVVLSHLFPHEETSLPK
jgi:predicted PurR-regulated permease PerM